MNYARLAREAIDVAGEIVFDDERMIGGGFNGIRREALAALIHEAAVDLADVREYPKDHDANERRQRLIRIVALALRAADADEPIPDIPPWTRTTFG